MNKPHYIKAGWLIDGFGGPVRKTMLLTVENGIFTAIDRFTENNAPKPGSVTDLSRCTIMPPFVDCHVHLSMSGSTNLQTRQKQLTADYNEIRPRIAEHIHHHFSHGVLAVRDGGDHQGHTLRFKNEPAESKKEPVILKAAGRAWHRKGRYGKVIGRYPRDKETVAEGLLRENDSIDHIKIINSGLNSLSHFGKETGPQFTLDELKEVVNQARQRGRKVMVHANGQLPVRMALEAGCDSIEHGFFMGRENLQRMAETQTTWVPTACTMKALGESAIPHSRKIDKGIVEKNLHHQLQQMALAREYGVTIGLGTDAGSLGVLHGESVVEELKLLLKAGYSLPEALQCGSVNGAQLLGIDEIGCIAKGKPANFIVARATPAMLPRKLSYLEGIYLGGIPCDIDYFQKIQSDNSLNNCALAPYRPEDWAPTGQKVLAGK